MKFEEQFPELENHSWEDEDYELIKVEDVEKHCLSKQRVKEAIENIKTPLFKVGDYVIGGEEDKFDEYDENPRKCLDEESTKEYNATSVQMNIKKQLLKELGLG